MNSFKLNKNKGENSSLQDKNNYINNLIKHPDQNTNKAKTIKEQNDESNGDNSKKKIQNLTDEENIEKLDESKFTRF